MEPVIDQKESADINSQSRIEVADIFRNYIAEYRKVYKLHPDHYKVVNDILECRTAILGGHVYNCTECGHSVSVYNSCGNRHCPKCQTVAKARWLEDRKSELLPVPYFHVVFTLPHEINSLALCNKRQLYTLLFKAASETLLAFGDNPKNGLGGKLGLIAVLHTWDQKLNDHIHLHCLVPGVVLTDDENEFKVSDESYLFPVQALSKVFRGKYMEGLQVAFDRKELQFPGSTAPMQSPSGFKTLKGTLWSTDWVVYSKPPFSGPETVLEYMARYTHRVAISNHRIKKCEQGKVTFSYRNRKKDKTEEMTLDAVEFIRRFLLHVVPQNFMRIRHFGLFANRCKKRNISLCLELLNAENSDSASTRKSVEEIMYALTGEDIRCCPVCKKGVMVKGVELPKYLFGTAGSEIIRPPLIGKDGVNSQ